MLITNVDGNKYGDEEVLIVARHLPNLQILSACFGRTFEARSNSLDGVAAVATNLTKLEDLRIKSKFIQNYALIGRLLYLTGLMDHGVNDWTAVVLTKQLRRLTQLYIGKQALRLRPTRPIN